MYCFRDFHPEVEESGVFGRIRKTTPLEAVVAEANDWIAEHQIDVINMETVLLPRAGEKPHTNSHFSIHEGTQYTQTVRVWYRAT
jgi:hypothetical protein